ncbi:MAG: TolC family protein [Azoarcus sp.]|nr:TolC family protein [Azoarcus sp.]
MHPIERLRPMPLLCALIGALYFTPAVAQDATAVPSTAQARPSSLATLFEAAWQRRPEALSLGTRMSAAEAGREAARRWFAEPPAAEVSLRSDRLNRNDGAREYEAGLAFPLWLPGERALVQRSADAQLGAVSSRARLAQLETAGMLREAWWELQRAAVDLDLAETRLDAARALHGDVTRRQRAGQLALTDANRAGGVLADAQSELAGARSKFARARLALQQLVGRDAALPDAEQLHIEPLPEEAPAIGDSHPALAALLDESAMSRSAAALASKRSRANPELTLGVTRERGEAGARFEQTLTVGIRIPFGGGAQHRSEAGMAMAEAIEHEERAQLERLRLESDLLAAREAQLAAEARREAAERRATLAEDTLRAIAKSFRLGETSLPDRLLVELEASEARRALAHARIDEAEAISALRQALGLLPQ